MRVLVVANPRATTTTVRQRDVLVHALAADTKLEVSETNNRGHAAALACRAMRDGVDAVIALGGDGTVNEVVNGLLTDGVHDNVPALGIVPGGSTNVFARALGLPNDPVEATSVLMDSISTMRTRRIGLGMAAERYFLFTAGLGYDAAVVAAVESHRRRGRTSTHSLYVRTAVSTYFQHRRGVPRIRLELPDGRAVDDLRMALVNNCDPWTYLGNTPVSPTPRASFDTGLDVYGRTRMGAVGLLYSASRMLSRRPAAEAAGADAAASAERIGIDAVGAEPAGADAVAGVDRRPSVPALTAASGRMRQLTTRLPSRRRVPDGGAVTTERRLGARIEHDLSSFVLISDRPTSFQLDGDALDERQQIEFRAVAGAIRVLV